MCGTVDMCVRVCLTDQSNWLSPLVYTLKCHSVCINSICFVLFSVWFDFSDHVNLHRHRHRQINNWSGPSGLLNELPSIGRVKSEPSKKTEWKSKINVIHFVHLPSLHTDHRIKITFNWKLIKTLQWNGGKKVAQFKSHSLRQSHWHCSDGDLCVSAGVCDKVN